MLLIVDAGSTKIDWVLLEKDQTMAFVQTDGYNPYYSDSTVLKNILTEKVLQKINPENIKSVIFYGSGCSTPAKQELVSGILKKYFSASANEVHHDLLASAHALLGDSPGIACILGTGSNSCLYDGKDVVENVPSVGYFYGDEGSGTDFGKQLIEHYLRNSLPENIKTELEKESDLSFEKAMDAIYNNSMPNRFFASFSPFILKHKEDSFINNIIENAFDRFFTFQVSKYTDFRNHKICFVGSVAFHYQEILRHAAAKYELTVGKVIPNPVEGLIEYYRNKMDTGDL